VARLSEPFDRGGDALVSSGQRNSHMVRTARAVEVAGRHQDAAGGQPCHGVATRLAAGGPQVQAAMVAALDDDAQEQLQRERYERRRTALLPALRSAGFTVDHSEAGLYLWATRDEPCRDSVTWLATRGILVAPGDFYGPGGANHVRVALTASDERIAAAVERLT